MTDLTATIVISRGELVALCLAAMLLGCACMLVAILMHADLRARRQERRGYEAWLHDVETRGLREFERRRVERTPLPGRRIA